MPGGFRRAGPTMKDPQLAADIRAIVAYIASAASFHPGDANFAFCDGSVRLLKDPIGSWQIQPGATSDTDLQSASGSGSDFPVDLSRDSKGGFVLATGTKLGVSHQLSTRNGGEAVRSDQC